MTAGDVHWARVGDRMPPVGETEFARDATFGYRASNLRDYVAEKSGGAIGPTAVYSIGLHDVRLGGLSPVADILMQVTDGAFVVVNATDYADLEIVVPAGGRGRGTPSSCRGLGSRSRACLPDCCRGRRSPRRPFGPEAGRQDTDSSSSARTSASAVRSRWLRRRGGARRGRASSRCGSGRASIRPSGGGRCSSDRDAHRGRMRCRSPAEASSVARMPRALDIARRSVGRGRGGGSARLSAWVVAKGGSPRMTPRSVAWRSAAPRWSARMLAGAGVGTASVDAPPEMVGVPYVVFAGNVGD